MSARERERFGTEFIEELRDFVLLGAALRGGVEDEFGLRGGFGDVAKFE